MLSRSLPPDERGVPCRWEDEKGICVLDGLLCEICEDYEAKTSLG
jgi:hypothetical protein